MVTPTKTSYMSHNKIEVLPQDCSNSSALAMELLQSCDEPSGWLLSYCNPCSEHFTLYHKNFENGSKDGRFHDDVIKWKHFPRNWPFVRGIHRSPLNSQHKGQWRGALMISFICVWIEWLSKQSWGWWFETLSRSLWRHRNVKVT